MIADESRNKRAALKLMRKLFGANGIGAAAIANPLFGTTTDQIAALGRADAHTARHALQESPARLAGAAAAPRICARLTPRRSSTMLDM
jgi:hypothetical protein